MTTDTNRHPDQSDVQDNRSNWDDRAQVHAQGGYGDLEALIKDPEGITEVVKRDLAVLKPHLPSGSVRGRSLLHLQCHIGTDTLSWYRLGAKNVHGLDFSPKSLEYARQIAAKASAPITYVEADARYADQAIPDQHFDLIVTSVGTIVWLPDLEDWATSIAQLLAPGGVFMIRDNHPLLFALDNDGLTICQDYRAGTESTYYTDASYTPGSSGKIQHTTNHNWAHDFQELTSVLLKAGLTIEALGEHELADWQALPQLVYQASDESWRLPEGFPRIPLTFSLVARKPN